MTRAGGALACDEFLKLAGYCATASRLAGFQSGTKLHVLLTIFALKKTPISIAVFLRTVMDFR